MNRLLKLHVDEIVSDPQGASEMLNSACSHSRKMKLTGCCQTGDIVIASFEETARPTRLRHVFARFPDPSENGLVDEINNRYTFGFTTVSSFRARGQLWGLFSFDPNAKPVHPPE
jgi:hypothetical protein